ncbi:MAG: Ribonucleoside-diphosphate reductase subunit alpha [Candidatus Parcubacteria bacterium]|jgi:ribonucleoside-diphosphate reductase alpha chain
MEKLQQIKKRNGELVPFSAAKITRAVEKAFIEKGVEGADTIAARISELVVKELDAYYGVGGKGTPSVEQTQDLAEKYIMEQGYYDVAKAYILYRYERAQVREEAKQEVLEKIEEGGVYVTKKDGHKEVFSLAKLKKSLVFVTTGYEDIINVDAIVSQVKLEIYDGITTKEIDKALIMVVRSLIEQDPAYSSVASRLVVRGICEEIIGDKINWADITAQYRQAFIDGIKHGVSIKVFDSRMLAFDLQKLAAAIDPSRDELFMYLGSQTLYDRYFARDIDDKNRVIELPQAFWMRVGMGLALLEKDKEASALEFYEVVSNLRFVPSTPTLFHAGTTHPQLSSCYLNTVEDSLEEIFKSYSDNAQLSKYSGGIGTDWSNIRGTGSIIRGTGVESQGLMPFLKIANDVTVAINRSGRRRGAAAVYLESWHYDIEDYLELRKNTGDERRRTHDINTANWIPDLFMKRVRADGDWTLFSPDEVLELHHIYGKAFETKYIEYEAMADRGDIRMFKRMKARDLWKKMITMLFETGHPWITFKDPCNVRSPQDHVGVVHNSNLCTEITLNNSADETAVCNLGSVNMPMHMKDGVLDAEMLARTVKTGMRMLDNVIDVNFYPTKEAKASNMKHRPVGLGIMGFHDALYMMNVRFDSDDAVRFADESMEIVSYAAIMASSLLAKERGAYESYKGSKWDRNIFPIDTLALLEEERGMTIDVPKTGKLDWTPVREHVKKYGMRNSNTMAIAPTATISNIAGSIPTIEPIYKNIYVKSNASGDFTVINEYLVKELKSLSLWDYEMLGKIKYNDGSIKAITEIPLEVRDKYKEVFEIAPEWLIKTAAYRGKWIDQSQSLNVYFSGTSGRELAAIYDYAWEMGLKTTYYLRTLGASQVEKSTVSTTEFGSTHKREAATVDTISKSDAAVQKQTAEMSPTSTPVQPVELTAAQKMAAAAATDKQNGTAAPKLCMILDPDCEACQ